MITVFGKSIFQSKFEEIIPNQQVRDIFIQASKKASNPNFDVQKIRRVLDRKVLSLQEINTFSNFLKREHQRKDKTEAYQKVIKDFPIQLVVRGDGNCFYRSFMVNYILKLVFNQEQEEFFKLIENIWNFKEYHILFETKQIQISTEEYKFISIRFLFDVFMKKSSNQINIYSFIESYNNHPEVDVSLIVICRNIIKQYFNKNSRNPSKQSFIDDDERVQIPTLLDTYGSEGQGIIISFSSSAFNSTLKLQNLFRDNKSNMVTTLIQYNESKNTNICVEVLYTQGHYNVIFDNKFSQEFLQQILGEQQQEKQQASLFQSISNKLGEMFMPKQSEQPPKDTKKEQQKEEPKQDLESQNQQSEHDQQQHKGSKDHHKHHKKGSTPKKNNKSHKNDQHLIDDKNRIQLQNLKDEEEKQKPQSEQLTNKKQSSQQMGRQDPFQNNKPNSTISTQQTQKKKVVDISIDDNSINPVQNLQQLNLTSSKVQQNNSIQEQEIFVNVPKAQGDSQQIQKYAQRQVASLVKSNDILQLQKRQQQVKPKLFKRDCCDFCGFINKSCYDLYYVQICQDCVVQNLFCEIKADKNKVANSQILLDILRIVKQDKLCLNCLMYKPYEVKIEKYNYSSMQQFICGLCQNLDKLHQIFQEFSYFNTANKQFIQNLLQQYDQVNPINIQPIKQQHPNIQGSLISQVIGFLQGGTQKIASKLANTINDSIEFNIPDSYRERLRQIVNTKQPAERDHLIEKLAQTQRFQDSCFKCESSDYNQFEIILQNKGHIRLCIGCLDELENIFQAANKDGICSLYCSLISDNVILHVTKDQHQYFKIKNSCFQCFSHDSFPLKVRDNIQLCYRCISNSQEYLNDDNKLVKLIKNQYQHYQRCLGCSTGRFDHQIKVLRKVYLCRICLGCIEPAKALKNNDYLIFNRIYQRHIKVNISEISDYMIDEKENKKQLSTESSNEEYSQDSLSQQTDEYSQGNQIQQIVDCNKCNLSEYYDNLKQKLECSCKFNIAYCFKCDKQFNMISQFVEFQTLSNKSILKYQQQDSLRYQYYFKNRIKLVICKQCNLLQQHKEQYEDYQT